MDGPPPLVALLICIFAGMWANELLVPDHVTAVLDKSITLTCRVVMSTSLSFTQSSWERRMPSGTITLAVFNPQYGISIADEYNSRVHYLRPSVHDVSIVLEAVSFADIGSYTCKVVIFELGIMQASTTVNVIVEPNVYVSPGPFTLVDGDGEMLVATCVAERCRPAARVFWESDLKGRAEVSTQESDGTTTTEVRYIWAPTRDGLGRVIRCIVRHPALSKEFRTSYKLRVLYAPDVMVVGQEEVWAVGQTNVKLDCRADANPPAEVFQWSRLDVPMPAGVDTSNGSLVFARPLQQSDSGQYRCEVQNAIGMRFKDVHILIQDAPVKQRAHFTFTTQASPADRSLATVGGAVGGILILVVLMAGVFYMHQRSRGRICYFTNWTPMT